MIFKGIGIIILSMSLLIFTGCTKDKDITDITPPPNEDVGYVLPTELPDEDLPGTDPANVERLPESIRLITRDGISTYYVTSISIDEITSFYKNIAEQKGLELVYGNTDETETQHWYAIGAANIEDSFAMTIAESIKYPGNIDLIIYSSNWTE